MSTPSRPRLSFFEIWNMSFGFLGIQFGFGLQLANMSAIYAKLGAEPEKIPILWLAGPMTGLLIQPIIGAMSDRTWNWLGRRRPYFTVGALLSSATLFLMPDAPAVWAAATMLWILDTSINISMEPFRAFVADKLPPEQRTTGFVMQSFFIGVGAALASALPAILAACGVSGNASNGVPLTVQYAFKLGAAAFLLAVMWTVCFSKEYPPEDMAGFLRRRAQRQPFRFNGLLLIGGIIAGGLLGISRGYLIEDALTYSHVFFGSLIGAAIGSVLSGPEVSTALCEMPRTMRQLAVVQFFTWLGLFCMWMFFNHATAQQIFQTTDGKSKLFDEATQFSGQTFAWYSIVCFLIAFALPPLAAITSRKVVHSLALLCGGLSLVATGFIHDRTLWQCTMIGVGIAWASILSMPYAMLSGALPPARMGVYMGIFNFFIVIPEILASLCLEPVVKRIFGNDPVKVVMLGGASMLVAALAAQFVHDQPHTAEQLAQVVEEEEMFPGITPPEPPPRA